MSIFLAQERTSQVVARLHNPPSSVSPLQRAEVVCSATMALARAHDLDTVAGILLDYLSMLVSYDVANVCLVTPGGRLSPQATRGWRQGGDGMSCRSCMAAADVGQRQDHSCAGRTTGLVVGRRGHPWGAQCPGLQQAQSCIVVPLIMDGETLGWCQLGRAEAGFYRREHARWAEAIVSQAAAAIRNIRMSEEAESERARFQSLSRQMVEAQEEERRRIARELHDEASQVLTTLNLQLYVLDKAANDPQKVRREVTSMTALVARVTESLHRLAVGLRPPCLDNIGLVTALDQYCETLAREQELRVELESDNGLGRLPSDVETTAYRIVQEALVNVVRHARASRATVVLENRGERLLAMVEDDGVGFDPAAAAASGRLGLLGMRERADAAGGSLEIESTPGRGTRVYLELPCA